MLGLLVVRARVLRGRLQRYWWWVLLLLLQGRGGTAGGTAGGLQRDRLGQHRRRRGQVLRALQALMHFFRFSSIVLSQDCYILGEA